VTPRNGSNVVAAASNAAGTGYWTVTAQCVVATSGAATLRAGAPTAAIANLKGAIVDIVPTNSGNGFYLIAADGGVFAFGSADFHGSLGSVRLNSPIVDIAPLPSGRGYRMLGADDGIFSFGAASPTVGSAVGLTVAPAGSMLG
jgi:hypothetical protein